jgi:HSP20 family molecular chaperone IbpA
MRTAPAATARESGRQESRPIAPPVDIYETDTMVVLLADVPGVTADSVDVTAERDTLTIRGRVERQPAEPDYQEFELRDYDRSFTLTQDLEADRVTATLRDGVLRVEIPKSARVQPKRIPVKAD